MTIPRPENLESKSGPGYIAFTALLILSAVFFLAGVTLTLLSVFQAQQSLSQENGSRAHLLADGCAEDALLESFNSSDYAGGTRTYPEGTCTVSVSKVGNNWVLEIESILAAGYRKRVRVNILRGDNIQVLSWKQVE